MQPPYDEREYGEWEECRAKKEYEVVRSYRRDIHCNEQRGHGLDDKLNSSRAGNPYEEKEEQCAEDELPASDGPLHGEECCTYGGEGALCRNIAVVVGEWIAFFQEYPCSVEYEDGAGRKGQQSKQYAERAHDERKAFIWHAEGGISFRPQRAENDHHKEQDASADEEAHEHQRERKESAVPKVVQTPHGRGDGEERQCRVHQHEQHAQGSNQKAQEEDRRVAEEGIYKEPDERQEEDQCGE